MGYNPRKAAQVIAYFASKTDNDTLPVLKAIKLVYLADRQSIADSGFPILNEDRVSMPHGPVNSTTRDYIEGYRRCPEGWSAYLDDRANHQICAKYSDDEDWDELSDFEIECLDRVWEKFGGMNEWELRDWTHDPNNVPEWENPGSSSTLIPIERILRSVGVENYVDVAANMKSFAACDEVIANLED